MRRSRTVLLSVAILLGVVSLARAGDRDESQLSCNELCQRWMGMAAPQESAALPVRSPDPVLPAPPIDIVPSPAAGANLPPIPKPGRPTASPATAAVPLPPPRPPRLVAARALPLPHLRPAATAKVVAVVPPATAMPPLWSPAVQSAAPLAAPAEVASDTVPASDEPRAASPVVAVEARSLPAPVAASGPAAAATAPFVLPRLDPVPQEAATMPPAFDVIAALLLAPAPAR